MLKTLANHNEDLKRLLDKGYAVGFDSNCLLVRDIPYLDAAGSLQWGMIVSKLIFVDEHHVRPDGHQIWFAGSHPHGLDGAPVRGLGGGTGPFTLSDRASDVVVQRSFSHKLKADGSVRDYVDLFEKIETYVAAISGPAIAKYDVTALTWRDCDDEIEESVFKLRDTMTSRAELSDLAQRFREDVVAVIGLGGTGSYVLDFLVKTPVREIRAFDADRFYVHNAFRSPGRLTAADDEGELGALKASVYGSRYGNFRHGLHIEPVFIDGSSGSHLDGVTFAFVCVDKGSSRKQIFDLLVARQIPFIDVGMGLTRKPGPISGTVRMTYYPPASASEMRLRGYSPEADPREDVYRTNIQIAELNALNACLAVMRFKQLRSFYSGPPDAVQHLFTVDNMSFEVE